MKRKSEGKERMEGSGAAGQSSHRAVVPIKEKRKKEEEEIFISIGFYENYLPKSFMQTANSLIMYLTLY